MSSEEMRKVLLEEELTEAEMAELDRALDAQEAQGVKRLVAELEEDVPSLAWRSALNEQLAKQTPASKQSKRSWLGRWGWTGLALAGALAVVAIVPLVRKTSAAGDLAPKAPIEATLVAAHQESSSAIALATNAYNSEKAGNQVQNEFENDLVDIQGL